jgi:hypothetical protein
MTEQSQAPQGDPGDGTPGDQAPASTDTGPTQETAQQPAQVTTIPADQAPDSEPAPEPEAGSPSGSPVHHEGVQGEGAEANPVGHQGLSPESVPEDGGQG